MPLSLSARVSILSNVVALGALALAWSGWPAEPPFAYNLHKALHIAGVVLFAGNLVAGPLWIAYAWFRDDGAHLPFAVRTLVDADIWITTPGLHLTIWNGLAMASALGGIQVHPWLLRSMVALLVTSALALVWVVPAQEGLLAAVETRDPAKIRRAMVSWSVGGTLISVPLSLVFWWMVNKG